MLQYSQPGVIELVLYFYKDTDQESIKQDLLTCIVISSYRVSLSLELSNMCKSGVKVTSSKSILFISVSHAS